MGANALGTSVLTAATSKVVGAVAAPVSEILLPTFAAIEAGTGTYNLVEKELSFKF